MKNIRPYFMKIIIMGSRFSNSYIKWYRVSIIEAIKLCWNIWQLRTKFFKRLWKFIFNVRKKNEIIWRFLLSCSYYNLIVTLVVTTCVTWDLPLCMFLYVYVLSYFVVLCDHQLTKLIWSRYFFKLNKNK